LYGLPYQTEESLERSIEHLMGLNPDRVALYGYAHVPWMPKRQTIIPQEALPPTRARFLMSERAKVILQTQRMALRLQRIPDACGLTFRDIRMIVRQP